MYDDLVGRAAAVDAEALALSRGLAGRTRVRPAGVQAGESRCFRITEATVLDELDPLADLSGLGTVAARRFLPDAAGGQRQIAIKFPQPIVAQGPLHIGCASRGYCRVEQWDPNAYNLNVWVRAVALGRAISGFNGLTPATLNWSNRGSLALGASLSGTQIAQAFAHNATGSGAALASGYSDSSFNLLPVECGLRFNCGASQTLAGILLELEVQESNVYYGSGGFSYGELEIVRGDTEAAWNFFCFYNPK